MSKNFKLGVPLGLAALFLGYLIYSSLSLSPINCEICVEFRGKVECRRASGPTLEDTIQTGVQNACSLITNGRDELIPCTSRQPQAVTCTE